MEKSYKENFTDISGIRLYSLYTPVHSFMLSLYIPAGPLYDGSENAGMSHLFEHCVFRNVNALMNGELYRELDRHGLTMSGATYNELVQIGIQGSPQSFEKAVDILLLSLSDFVIGKEEYNAEKERIKREIREDTYHSSVDAMSQKAIWEGTGLAEAITGSVGKISKTSLRQISSFTKTLLVKNNIFFYLTGAFSAENIKYLTNKLTLISLPSGKERKNIAAIPKKFFKRTHDITVRRDSYCKVKLAFDIDCEKTSKPARDLVYDILFQGDTSKVFLELSEKNGYVYSFDANIDEYKNIGSVSLSFETAHADFENALICVRDIFNSVKENITDDELSLAKVPYTLNSEFILDDSENLNWNKAWEGHILGYLYPTIADRKKAYESVSALEALEAANEIFKTENLSVCAKHKNPEAAISIINKVFS